MIILRNKEFAETNKHNLANYSSKRGIGRSAIVGLGPGGLVGRYAGMKAGEAAARNGGSDKKARNTASLVGAGTGAAAGLGIGAGGYYSGKKLIKKAVNSEQGKEILKGVKEGGVPKEYITGAKKLAKGAGKVGVGVLATGGALGGLWGARKAINSKIKKRDRDELKDYRSAAKK